MAGGSRRGNAAAIMRERALLKAWSFGGPASQQLKQKTETSRVVVAVAALVAVVLVGQTIDW